MEERVALFYDWQPLRMTSRAELCKEHAAHCDRHAVLAADENIRRQYVDLAKQWRQMADQLERLDGRGSARFE